MTEVLETWAARIALWAGLAIATAGAIGLPVVARAAEPGAAGVWYDDTGRGAVELRPCGGGLCGYVYWLRDPINAEGKPLRDRYNPDAAAQQRPICGLQVIGDLAAQPDGSWDGGWIYDPKVGKTYKVEVRQQGPDTLTVRGYLSIKLMGKSYSWSRAPKDLPACDGRPPALAR
ncbi:MAG: DUF2147 domain-containing protein [Hyphomicrobiaceae bacterium]|nr:DUF2147 domain-containing protein [Hyphomicrobiaceae bacterium]